MLWIVVIVECLSWRYGVTMMLDNGMGIVAGCVLGFMLVDVLSLF